MVSYLASPRPSLVITHHSDSRACWHLEGIVAPNRCGAPMNTWNPGAGFYRDIGYDLPMDYLGESLPGITGCP